MRSEANTMRLFIGCGLQAADTALVAAHIDQATWPDQWRMLDRASWHVTALFIGERPAEACDPLLATVEAHAASFAPITLSEGTLCSMPEAAPSMRWVRFLPHPGLTALHHALAGALDVAPSPFQPYWPHITLARSRGGQRHVLEHEGLLLMPTLRLTSLSLYRSDRSANGRIHRPIATRPFIGTGPADPAAVA
ncbi:MAG: hypothetical protein MUE88_05400 [Flavobacteriales bacterium]|jgi:2'-5' RNA ligase|nr:hypothetical protein [Flavobacteriales bacterium]